MKYPRLPDYLDRRRKVFKKQISLMQKMTKEGFGIAEIARIFNVTKYCVRYNTDQKFAKRQKEYLKEWRKDNEDKKATNKRHLATMKYSISQMPELHRKYHREYYRNVIKKKKL